MTSGRLAKVVRMSKFMHIFKPFIREIYPSPPSNRSIFGRRSFFIFCRILSKIQIASQDLNSQADEQKRTIQKYSFC